MIDQPTLDKLIDGLVRAKGRELAEQVPDNRPRQTLASVSYGLGFQAALELALIDPVIATDLIEAIHDKQERDDPGSREEFNTTALTMIALADKLSGNGPRQEPRRHA